MEDDKIISLRQPGEIADPLKRASVHVRCDELRFATAEPENATTRQREDKKKESLLYGGGG
jgi:hypothetical protein